MSSQASSLSNPGNFLRVQRNFPEEIQPLTVEINKAYVDIANQVNSRISGIFTVSSPAITGESWYFQGGNARQQTLRQVYNITGAGSYAHGISFASVSRITKIYGAFVDSAGVWYPLPYVDVTSVTNQVSIIVNSTDIVITAGAGSPPAITLGQVVLEWLSVI